MKKETKLKRKTNKEEKALSLRNNNPNKSPNLGGRGNRENFFIDGIAEPIHPKDITPSIPEKELFKQMIAERTKQIKIKEGLFIGSKREPDVLWQEKFFYMLQSTGNIGKACLYAGVTRQYVHNLRKKDDDEGKEFNELVQLCKDDYLEQLESEADRRGYQGYHEEVIYKGERTNIFVKRYSDYLLALRLKAEGGAKYREGGTSVNVKVDNRKQVVLGFTDNDDIFQIE